ncbi:GNAT family N-acetyltransferase [Candidatus Deianiraea vastatrix]|uniref:GNAT acetyltransferase n=1 Tax=Candidatus Deianiraea vastatrix TaxID=2163644 RepID=A0A5B8XH27_9RICK|nr:GNAT family N-acetyltransferase [Candidatus Deianiraea vastatrix]QED23167.1 GNAT acetyltransferase [Candidatus Deianiraea vastatrix]
MIKKFENDLLKLPNATLLGSDDVEYIKLSNGLLAKCHISPYMFLAGNINDNEINHHFDDKKEIKLFCHEINFETFFKLGWKLSPRVELSYKGGEINHIASDEINIALLDENNFQNCTWYDFMLTIYKDKSSFLKRNFGFIALIGGEIAGECYTCATSNEKAEIAIITSEKFRNKGIASILTKCLINECLKRNLIPIWTCATENIPSFKTALRNNFCIDKYYLHPHNKVKI